MALIHTPQFIGLQRLVVIKNGGAQLLHVVITVATLEIRLGRTDVACLFQTVYHLENAIARHLEGIVHQSVGGMQLRRVTLVFLWRCSGLSLSAGDNDHHSQQETGCGHVLLTVEFAPQRGSRHNDSYQQE